MVLKRLIFTLHMGFAVTMFENSSFTCSIHVCVMCLLMCVITGCGICVCIIFWTRAGRLLWLTGWLTWFNGCCRVRTWLRYGLCIWFLSVFCSYWMAIHGNEVSQEAEYFIRCEHWWSWNGNGIVCFHWWCCNDTSIVVLAYCHGLIGADWWSWNGFRLWGRDVTWHIWVVVCRAIGQRTVAWWCLLL